MENFLERFPSPYALQALEIAQRIRQAGHRVLICGGTVRDYLLGRRTDADIDLATSGTPEEIQKICTHSVMVGAQFGVVMIPVEGKNIEVATFRKDAEYSNGRHPTSVHYADKVEDARRRDFTINAMFLDPFSGELLDYVGG